MELLYVVCQLAAADVCEEHRLAMYAANPLVCIHGAPPELARAVLPGWRVARWSCGTGRAAAGLDGAVAYEAGAAQLVIRTE